MRKQRFKRSPEKGSVLSVEVHGYVDDGPGLFGTYRDGTTWHVIHLPTGMTVGLENGFKSKLKASSVIEKLLAIKVDWGLKDARSIAASGDMTVPELKRACIACGD